MSAWRAELPRPPSEPTPIGWRPDGWSDEQERAFSGWRQAMWDDQPRRAESILQTLKSARLGYRHLKAAAEMSGEISTASPAVWHAVFELRLLAEHFVSATPDPARLPKPNNLVLVGAPGVGKTTFAAALHGWSNRTGPFIEADVGGLHGDILLSELFGHEKGAFTGAVDRRIGLVEKCADKGGTILIDEFLDLPELQPPLLRLLQTGRFRRVGGTDYITAKDLVIVLASNRAHTKAEFLALPERVLRSDLSARLDQVVALPPLKGRIVDIREITTRVSRSCQTTIDPESLRWLEDQSWPGNVRQLERALREAARWRPPDSGPLRVPGFLRQSATADCGTGNASTAVAVAIATAILDDHDDPYARSLVQMGRERDVAVAQLRGSVLLAAVSRRFSRSPAFVGDVKAEVEAIVRKILSAEPGASMEKLLRGATSRADLEKAAFEALQRVQSNETTTGP